jgi:hypothetical protein
MSLEREQKVVEPGISWSVTEETEIGEQERRQKSEAATV